jgi:hypothetical protein
VWASQSELAGDAIVTTIASAQEKQISPTRYQNTYFFILFVHATANLAI